MFIDRRNWRNSERQFKTIRNYGFKNNFNNRANNNSFYDRNVNYYQVR